MSRFPAQPSGRTAFRCPELTNELIVADGIPVEPPVIAESASTKPRRWRWFMAGVLSTVLIAGGVFGVIEATKPKGVTPATKAQGVTPASINAAMAKFCAKGSVVGTVGLAQTSESEWPVANNAVGSLRCWTADENLLVYVDFFCSAFDENSTITGHFGTGDFPLSSGFASIGKGYIGRYYYSKPHNGLSDVGETRITEGQFMNWMTATFGAKPISHGFPVQRWTETLPSITLESFGSPKPIVDEP